MTRYLRPRIEDLDFAPELAVLAVLETAADVARLALLTAHPDEGEFEDDPPPRARVAARALGDAIRDVADALNRYRLALHFDRQRDRLPF